MKYAALFLFLCACSSSSTTVASPAEDAGTDGAVATTQDGGADTGTASSACDATCRKSTFVATFDGATVKFDRAQFGVETGGSTRRVEAYGGGDPACPTETSPTPDRTLIIAGAGGDAPKVSYFDFAGTGVPVVKATAVTITNVVKLDDVVAFDIDATFANGTVKGHLASTFCMSLSD